MFKKEILEKVAAHFPDAKIKFKDESWLMKLIGKIMFFNKNFMTQFTTTLGSTVYFPSQSFVDIRPLSSLVILLHELVHIKDAAKQNKIVFGLKYAFPQILALLSFVILIFSWKLALIPLVFLLPLPAYFRMVAERRAYFASLYVIKKMNDKFNYSTNLSRRSEDFIKEFKESTYYYMWPFAIEKEFAEALVKIEAGGRPFDDEIFDILDEIVSVS